VPLPLAWPLPLGSVMRPTTGALPLSSSELGIPAPALDEPLQTGELDRIVLGFRGNSDINCSVHDGDIDASDFLAQKSPRCSGSLRPAPQDTMRPRIRRCR
jgi:hypothetical protein